MGDFVARALEDGRQRCREAALVGSNRYTIRKLKADNRELKSAIEARDKQNGKLMKRLAQKEAIIIDLMAMDRCPHFENGDALDSCPLKEPVVDEVLYCDNCADRLNCADDHKLGLASIAPYGGGCYVPHEKV